MARTIREARPTIVAMPDPADVHPDHRATAAFSLLALGDVLAEPDRRPGPRRGGAAAPATSSRTLWPCPAATIVGSMRMAIVGRVVGIFRHPVKSMRGERIDEAWLAADGLAGDRGWAVRDDVVGEIRGAKKLPDLLRCTARYPEEPATGRITAAEIGFPDGTRLRSDAAGVAERLSALLGRPVSLWPRLPAESREHYRRAFEEGVDPMEDLRQIFGRLPDEPLPDLSVFPPELFELTSPAGTYFDAFPLHLVTTGHLGLLQRLAPGSSFDPLRFRPNLLVETAGEAASPPEFDWCGREVRIGDATVSVTVPCPRCVMTTLPQGDLPKDPAVLRTIVRESDQAVGVYANVATAGRVAVGDAVELS